MEGNIRKTLRHLFFGLIIMTSNHVRSQDLVTEDDYSRHIQTLIGGEREVLIDGGRIDLLLENYAFEIEWAYNWKEAIGQSLWYGLNTNRKPGIILIMSDRSDNKHDIRLNTALNYAGLSEEVMVLRYPQDFKKLLESKESRGK